MTKFGDAQMKNVCGGHWKSQLERFLAESGGGISGQ